MRYVHLPHKIVSDIKQWDLVHLNLVGMYDKSVTQENTGINILLKFIRLAYMKIVNPMVGCFKIFKPPLFYLVISLLEIRNMQIYNFPGKDNCSTKHGYADTHTHAKSCLKINIDLNRYFLPFLKFFSINIVRTKVKNPQASTSLEQFYKEYTTWLLLSILITNAFTIYPWGGNLMST